MNGQAEFFEIACSRCNATRSVFPDDARPIKCYSCDALLAADAGGHIEVAREPIDMTPRATDVLATDAASVRSPNESQGVTSGLDENWFKEAPDSGTSAGLVAGLPPRVTEMDRSRKLNRDKAEKTIARMIRTIPGWLNRREQRTKWRVLTASYVATLTFLWLVAVCNFSPNSLTLELKTSNNGFFFHRFEPYGPAQFDVVETTNNAIVTKGDEWPSEVDRAAKFEGNQKTISIGSDEATFGAGNISLRVFPPKLDIRAFGLIRIKGFVTVDAMIAEPVGELTFKWSPATGCTSQIVSVWIFSDAWLYVLIPLLAGSGATLVISCRALWGTVKEHFLWVSALTGIFFMMALAAWHTASSLGQAPPAATAAISSCAGHR